MKPIATAHPPEPILVDDAHSFGVGAWEPGKRGKGVLCLTDTALTFVPAGRGAATEILLDTITGIGAATRSGGAPAVRNVLRVTYSKNLVLGLAVAEPQRWVNAIHALTQECGRKTVLDGPVVSGFELHRFRVVVGMFLLLIVLMSTAFPLFLTWMNARVNSSAGSSTAGDVPSVAY